jgi:DNA polymerase (family 10)
VADTNRQLAAIFQQMADVTELLGGDRFRVNAFSKAARVLGDLTDDLAAIGPDEKKLTALPGIGKGTAQRIAEYLRTGRVTDHDELMGQVPKGVLAMLEIPGLGPKTVALLWREGGVESIADLKAALATDRLAELPGLGPRKLENLRKSLAFAEQAGQRVRLGQAMPVAIWFVQQLRRVAGVQRCEYAGSLRRGRETIGDIDVIVGCDEGQAAAIAEAFVGLEPVADVLLQGSTKTSVRTTPDAGGLQVDLRIVRPGQFGAALMYFTGSKDHNVRLRERAIAQGLRLNEYGLWRAGSTPEPAAEEGAPAEPVAAATEQEVFETLGLPWIPPELREDRGEIALAERGELPELVTAGDIVAELHAHTDASDGRWSMRELVEAAIDRGFHTVAITDHSRSQVQAHGLSIERLEAQIAAIRELAEAYADRIRVLAGSEVDILADGKLDYPDSLLKQLDVVVASPHSALTQDAKKATRRLLKAMENRYVTVLGHPTGRLVGRREGLAPDMSAVIRAARQRGIALEINANHYRLDLRDTHARAALDAGVRLAINTDAHGPGDLDELRYGVLTARRAGATAGHVVNCLSASALERWLKSTRP